MSEIRDNLGNGSLRGSRLQTKKKISFWKRGEGRFKIYRRETSQNSGKKVKPFFFSQWSKSSSVEVI